jgi:hypothetical protein
MAGRISQLLDALIETLAAFLAPPRPIAVRVASRPRRGR